MTRDNSQRHGFRSLRNDNVCLIRPTDKWSNTSEVKLHTNGRRSETIEVLTLASPCTRLIVSRVHDRMSSEAPAHHLIRPSFSHHGQALPLVTVIMCL